MDFLTGVWWTWVLPRLGMMLTTAALVLVSAGLSDQESA
jgi:ABC-type dipeptide/oligopeptide/nickel transport system permease subunit